MQSGTRQQNQERGQSLIELALTLPILMLILTGVLDLGRAYYAYITVTNAAREGARWGADYQTDNAGILAAAKAEAAGSGFPIDSCTITVSTPNGTSQGNPITVTVSCNYHLITGTIVGA